MKNEEMEAIAKDYSELHIDISVLNVGTEQAEPENVETPTTFMAMTTPKGSPGSARKKGKKGRFNIFRLFGSLKRKSPTSSPKQNNQADAEEAGQ